MKPAATLLCVYKVCMQILENVSRDNLPIKFNDIACRLNLSAECNN